MSTPLSTAVAHSLCTAPDVEAAVEELVAKGPSPQAIVQASYEARLMETARKTVLAAHGIATPGDSGEPDSK